MKHVFISITLFAIFTSQPSSYAQNTSRQFAVRDATICNQLMLASLSPITDEELTATLANLFSKRYPIFVSKGFRTVALGRIAAAESVTNKYTGQEIRKKLRDMQIDRPRYQPTLNSIAGAMFHEILSNFISGSPKDALKKYSIKAVDFEAVKLNLQGINSDPRLRGLMTNLIGEVFFDSIDMWIRYSAVDQSLDRLEAMDAGRGSALFSGPFALFYTSFYRYSANVIPFQFQKKFKIRNVLKGITHGDPGLDLDKFSVPVYAQDQGPLQKNSSFSELTDRFKVIPSALMLDRIDGQVGFEQSFISTMHEISVKQLTLHQQFLSPQVWTSFDTSFSGFVRSSSFGASDQTALTLGLKSFTQYLDSYLNVLQEQKMAYTVAMETLGTMNTEVVNKLALYDGHLSASDALIKEGLEKLSNRMAQRKLELTFTLSAIDDWVKRLTDASATAHQLEMENSPFQQQTLTLDSIKVKLRSMANQLAIPEFAVKAQ